MHDGNQKTQIEHPVTDVPAFFPLFLGELEEDMIRPGRLAWGRGDGVSTGEPLPLEGGCKGNRRRTGGHLNVEYVSCV